MAGLRECACDLPIPFEAPQKRDTCVCCGFKINPAWTSNDGTVREFFDDLADAMPGADPETWGTFRLHCEEREVAGRPKFQNVFLIRNNLREAREEAADLALYALLDCLKEIRAGRGKEDYALSLTIAKHAYLAYEATVALTHCRHGAP